MEEIREVKLSGKHGGIAKVSAVDFERVSIMFNFQQCHLAQ